MNIGEADDTMTLLRWLTSDQADDALTQKAKAAAARLADRSRRRIMAGMGGEEVLAKWPATHNHAQHCCCDWDPSSPLRKRVCPACATCGGERE